jgi:hypothetical protein
VVQLRTNGMTERAIGEQLGTYEFTVRCHASSISNKLCVTKRTEAVASAMRHGLLLAKATQVGCIAQIEPHCTVQTYEVSDIAAA